MTTTATLATDGAAQRGATRTWTPIVWNVVIFQITWWTCLLSVSTGAAWIALPAAGVALIVQVLVTAPLAGRSRGKELLFAPTAAAIGYVSDSVLYSSGQLGLNVAPGGYFAPLWVLALWLNFTLTLNVTFVFLRQRHLLTLLLGALSGPGAYYAGAVLGIAAFPHGWVSAAWIALGWALALELQVLLSLWVDRSNPASTTTASAKQPA